MQTNNVQSFAVTCHLSRALSLLCLLSEFSLQEVFFWFMVVKCLVLKDLMCYLML